MGDLDNLASGEKEALIAARLGDIRKKVNAESWSDNMELLMKAWGEKAAGLRFMHEHSGGKWKKFADNLAISGIIVTGVASTISLIATSVDDPDVKNGLLFGVGGVGLISTLIQSFKKFYNSEEKAADHGSVSKQFGSFYRYMTLQMGMSREDRDPADVLTTWALKEYERLQQEAPNIDGESIKLFRETFKDSDQAIPDIAEDKFIIKILKPKPVKQVEVKKDNNVEMIESSTNDKVEVNIEIKNE
uniref:VP11 n=1 Tax=viral metagenome TaxID=1070528 RepID=A0A6C0AYU9_9ZZZZ|tara:strand:+ start:36 stop:773 length:738 start_codon:yes stop_codon:yes gene_type:complete